MLRVSALLLFAVSVYFVNGQQCLNGGTPINSTSCQCPGYVVGDSCEIVKCMRFSVPDKNRCACAPGWYDPYCGLRGCRPPNEDHVDMNKRSVIIVFNTKTSMKTQLQTLTSNFKQMISSMITAPNKAVDNWIDNFIVYGFAQVGTQLQVQADTFTDVDAVVKYLNSFTLYDGDATQPVITALQTAMQTFPKMRSHATVMIFTDSPSSDATNWSHRFTDATAEQAVVQINLLWKMKYTFFLSLPDGTDYTTNGVDIYRRIALTGHGDAFFIKDTNDLQKALLSVMGCQYFSENIAVGYQQQQGTDLTTYVDNPGDTVYILLTIDTSTKSTLPTIAGVTLVAEGPSYRLYSRSSNIGDTVSITSASGNIYNYRMFIQSKATILIFYNDDMYIDVGNGMPVIGVGMSASMQTYGLPDFEKSSYELRSLNGTFLREKIWSYMRPQLDCTFLYGFPTWDSGNCPPGPATSVHTFFYNGYKQVRVNTAYCITSNHNPETILQTHGREKREAVREIEEEVVAQDDLLQCDKRSIDAIRDPRLKPARQYIFILEQHSGNQQVFNTLAKEINQILSLANATSENTYDCEFTVIAHDALESHVLLSAYNEVIFGEKFPKIVSSLKLYDNLDNTMGLLSIVQAQKMNIRPTAQIYYFTNQAVKNVQNVNRTWDIVSRDVEVNFFTIADGVTTEIFALPNQLELVQKMTNGRLIPLKKTEDTLLPLFRDMVTMTTLTTDNEQYNCHDNQLTINGYFEDGADLSVIQVVGTGLKTVTMQDSNGALVSVSDYITYQNPNFISFRIGSSKFASGVWKMSALATSGGCQIQVRQQTSVGAILGFTSSDTDDFKVVSQILTQRSTSNILPIFAAMKVTDGIVPTNLEIQIVNRKRYDQPQTYQNTTITQRDASTCTYNFISESVVVPKNELTTWTLSAYKAGKLLLHRIFYYYQHLPSDVSVCHGGETDKYGRCVCPTWYTGEYCWDRLCIPPATLSNGICCCTSGVHGDFCEVVIWFQANDTTAPLPGPPKGSLITSTIPTSTQASHSIFSITSIISALITSFIFRLLF